MVLFSPHTRWRHKHNNCTSPMNILRFGALALVIAQFHVVSVKLFPAFTSVPPSSQPVQDDLIPKRNLCLVEGGYAEDARIVASSLRIPIIPDGEEARAEYNHILRLVPYSAAGVETFALAIEKKMITDNDGSRRPKRRKETPKPVFVDFCPPPDSRIGKRGNKQGGSDLLIKAVNPSRSSVDGQSGAIIYDVTAGFGQDSLLLALNGAAHVTMVERDPVVSALLEDGLRRLKLVASDEETSDPQSELARCLCERLTLQIGEGKDVLTRLRDNNGKDKPDIIYLDPMFPPRTKSAAVKKGMQLLHDLLDTQDFAVDSTAERLFDEGELLVAALEASKGKVVVKRPLKAETLGGSGTGLRSPSYSINGSVNRWDIYVKS